MKRLRCSKLLAGLNSSVVEYSDMILPDSEKHTVIKSEQIITRMILHGDREPLPIELSASFLISFLKS